MFRFILAVLALVVSFTPPALAGLDEGRAAYNAKDWVKAIGELRPLAEAGDDEALHILGTMYIDGHGVAKDTKEALSLYERSANRYNDKSMLALAVIYAGGVGVEKNIENSEYWFKQSALFGNHASQFTLGAFYYKRSQTEPHPTDMQDAYKWYRIASANDMLPRVKHTSGQLAELIAKKLKPEDLAKTEEEIAAFSALTKQSAAEHKLTFAQPVPVVFLP